LAFGHVAIAYPKPTACLETQPPQQQPQNHPTIPPETRSLKPEIFNFPSASSRRKTLIVIFAVNRAFLRGHTLIHERILLLEMKTLFQQTELLLHLDALLRTHQRISAKEMAATLGISRSRLYTIFEELAQHGIRIVRCPNTHKISYQDPDAFIVQLPIQFVEKKH
jgi:biotin operon repressor